MTIYMTGISFFAQLMLYIFDKEHSISVLMGSAEESSSSKSALDFITGLYGESEELSKIKAWTSITIIFIFTLLTIRIVQMTRKDAKLALESFY